MTDMYDLAGEPRPKLCVNCKHIGRNGSGDPTRYRCFAPQNIRRKGTDLVTGNSITLYCADTCYDARQAGWCGAGGSWFEEAPPKLEEKVSVAIAYSRKEQATADLLSQLDKMK